MLVLRRDEPFNTVRKMKLNKEYIRSKAGILSSCLLFCLLISFICILASGGSSPTHAAFLVATIVGLIMSTILTAVKLFSIHETFKFPWTFIEFIYVIIWAIYFLVVSAVALDLGGRYIAAGIFGLFTTFLYIGKIVLIYMTEVVYQNTPTPYPPTQ